MDDGTCRSDMKPLFMPDDGDLQPAVPQVEPESTDEDATQDDISGPAPFQTAGSSAVSTETDSDVVIRPTEVDREPGTTRHNQQPEPEVFPTEEPPPTKVEVAGGLRHPVPLDGRQLEADKTATASVRPRPVVELSYSAAMDFYVGWFEQPWVAYLLVVVASTLMASAAEADPAALIVVVLISSALCFLLFPPPSEEDISAVRSPE